MGSLPNLHELGKDEFHTRSLYKPGPTYGPGGAAGSAPHPDHPERPRSATQRITSGTQQAKVCKTRSTGANNHVWDDMMLEQMQTYSPISSRSTRNLSHVIRRRDSMNSSIGATSVRRLISVVRNTHGRTGPIYSRRILLRNVLMFCLSHLIISITFMPFLALQSSVSLWTIPYSTRSTFVPLYYNTGSLLLALLHLCAAISTLLGPSLVHKLGTNVIFLTSYGSFVIFYATHLYPRSYVLIPSYILLGLTLGPMCVSRISFLLTISSKLSYSFSEDDEDSKNLRRTCIVRRVSRTFQTAQDVGLILGSILTALVITYTINTDKSAMQSHENSTGLSKTNQTYLSNAEQQQSAVQCVGGHLGDVANNGSECQAPCEWRNCTGPCPTQETNEIIMAGGSVTNSRNNCCAFNVTRMCQISPTATLNVDPTAFYVDSTYLDDIFDIDETGDRLCGAKACPVNYVANFNSSDENFYRILPYETTTILSGTFVALSAVALSISALGLDRIRMYIYQDPLERPEGIAALRAVKESFRDVKLQLAAPLAVFIGLEQAFMYADFSKSYVVCTLGIHRLNLVFLSMGLLQSIAACTLSMLLRTIRRYIVIAVGLAFHACLLMVQSLWKPNGDDPALFYVISAAWGVCNAVWEMLNFTLLTAQYPENWEAAFANSTFFRFMGLAIAFSLHGVLCNWLKVYALGAALLLALVPFTWLEVRLENIRKVKHVSRL